MYQTSKCSATELRPEPSPSQGEGQAQLGWLRCSGPSVNVASGDLFLTTGKNISSALEALACVLGLRQAH